MQFEEGKERTRERERKNEREREREHNLDCPLKKMRTKFSFSSFLNNCVTDHIEIKANMLRLMMMCVVKNEFILSKNVYRQKYIDQKA